MNQKILTIDSYINKNPKDVQEKLTLIRTTIKKAAPVVTETISYGIPTIKYKGKNLIHFAAFAKHFGIYPGPEAIDELSVDLVTYKISKGTIQIPITSDIPTTLITKLVKSNLKRIEL